MNAIRALDEVVTANEPSDTDSTNSPPPPPPPPPPPGTCYVIAKL